MLQSTQAYSQERIICLGSQMSYLVTTLITSPIVSWRQWDLFANNAHLFHRCVCSVIIIFYSQSHFRCVPAPSATSVELN